VLPRMTVGAVAGHLFLIVRRIDKHLDEPEPEATADRPAGSYRWLRVERPEDLDRADHRAVRDDGDHVAAWGWQAVESAYTARVAKLADRLSARRPQTVALETSLMDFRAYLATRVVELLVHADDLAVSVSLPPPPLPRNAATVAIDVLIDAARSIHGDLGVLRSLTRAGRVHPSVPSVY
jgi:hypothetical protein